VEAFGDGMGLREVIERQDRADDRGVTACMMQRDEAAHGGEVVLVRAGEETPPVPPGPKGGREHLAEGRGDQDQPAVRGKKGFRAPPAKTAHHVEDHVERACGRAGAVVGHLGRAKLAGEGVVCGRGGGGDFGSDVVGDLDGGAAD